jgi:hypothetical protein
MLVAAGTISYSLLIASDPLQYAVGTMYRLDAATWIWVIFWLLYTPVLFGLAWCIERMSRALVSTASGGRGAAARPEVAPSPAASR